jgi:class 3 adenylate cyclase/tetratricopeptide (TPR) repeat protein
MAGEQEVVVLFTDISGYTKFVSEKGSTAGAELVRRHDSIIKPILAQFGGVYVKGTGDGLIAYFELPHQAVLSAVKIQEALAAYNLSRQAEEQVHIKIGLQIGPAVIQEGEIIGHAVNFASRLVGVCQPGQIIIGNELHKRLKRIRHVTFKRIGATTLQGILKPEDVFEVGWHFETLEEKQKGSFLSEGTGRSIEKDSRYYKLGVGLFIVVFAGIAGWLILRKGGGTHPATVKPTAQSPARTEALPPERRLLQQALENELKGDDEQALGALDEAIRANPAFLEPYFRAAFDCYQTGQDTRAKEYLDKARQHQGSWDDEFRLKAEALAFALDREDDEALKKYQILADKDRSNPTYQYYLGDFALEVGKMETASNALNQCIRLDPGNPFCHFDRLMLQVVAGEFDIALSAYESLEKQNLNYPWLDRPVGYAFLAKGDLIAARKRFEQLANASGRFPGKQHYEAGKDGLADIALYGGELREAVKQLRRGMETAKDASDRAEYLRLLGEVHALVENKQAAREAAFDSTRQLLDPEVFIDAAKVLAIVGDRRGANRILSVRMSDGKPVGEPNPTTKHFIEGSLCLAESNPKKAVEELDSSYDLQKDDLTAFMLGRAYSADRRWEDAATRFEDLIKSKGRILVYGQPLLWVLAQYDLARCYDGLGKFDDARKWYSNFMEVWKLADSDLPQVVHAKRRLDELRRLQ